MLVVVLVFDADVLRLTFGYVPHSGRSLEEKQAFCDHLKNEWDIHSEHNLVLCFVTIMDTW